MAHFAEIENNKVKRIVVINDNEILDGDQESETKGIDFCESLYGHRNWVQTSNDNNFRYNFADIGYTWDSDNEAFYEPQPYSSWNLDENFMWQPPVEYPSDGNLYNWNEDTQTWDLIT